MKILLSSRNHFTAPLCLENFDRRLDFVSEMDRNTFEELNLDVCEIRPMQLIHAVLEESGLTKDQIHEVILVGGATKIPKIRDVLESFFQGEVVINTSLDAEESVAFGAALHGGALVEEGYARVLSEYACTVAKITFAK